jgi:hypothetical protein
MTQGRLRGAEAAVRRSMRSARHSSEPVDRFPRMLLVRYGLSPVVASAAVIDDQELRGGDRGTDRCPACPGCCRAAAGACDDAAPSPVVLDEEFQQRTRAGQRQREHVLVALAVHNSRENAARSEEVGDGSLMDYPHSCRYVWPEGVVHCG